MSKSTTPLIMEVSSDLVGWCLPKSRHRLRNLIWSSSVWITHGIKLCACLLKDEYNTEQSSIYYSIFVAQKLKMCLSSRFLSIYVLGH